MRLLMIGADAAHYEAFQRGWTPYLSERLATADTLPVDEDLLSRGWSRVALGQSADVTGGLYDRPDLDCTTGWSLKFRMNDVPGFGSEIKPIWQALNEKGFKVGVMNVPTVFPAPPVDGFFVSGGGGGAPVVQEVQDDFCYPLQIAESLRAWGYIVDERPNSLLGEKRMKTPEEVFQRLCHKNERRADAFTRLSKEFGVDFGFVVFKSSSVIAELLVLSELAAAERVGGTPDSAVMSAAERYYRHFDGLLKTLIEEFSDAEVLIVSDHGSIVPQWNFNTNLLLAKLKYQPRSISKGSATSAFRALKKYLPYNMRVKLKKSRAVKSRWQGLSVSPPAGSLAFSALLGSWRNGIFINDRNRFGGPVEPPEVRDLSEQLVDDINAAPETQRYRVRANLRPNDASHNSPHFPDITLSMPDNIITSPTTDQIVSTVSIPTAPLGLRTVTEGKLLCVKSSTALAANLTHRWQNDVTTPDLTAVYRHVLHRFDSLEAP